MTVRRTVLPRYTWEEISSVPFRNGIYLVFEQGEPYRGMPRIVRVDTHTSPNRLRRRLEDPVREREVELAVSDYLRTHMTFSVFQVHTPEQRLRFEEGLIAALHQAEDFAPSGKSSTIAICYQLNGRAFENREPRKR